MRKLTIQSGDSASIWYKVDQRPNTTDIFLKEDFNLFFIMAPINYLRLLAETLINRQLAALNKRNLLPLWPTCCIGKS